MPHGLEGRRKPMQNVSADATSFGRFAPHGVAVVFRRPNYNVIQNAYLSVKASGCAALGVDGEALPFVGAYNQGRALDLDVEGENGPFFAAAPRSLWPRLIVMEYTWLARRRTHGAATQDAGLPRSVTHRRKRRF